MIVLATTDAPKSATVSDVLSEAMKQVARERPKAPTGTQQTNPANVVDKYSEAQIAKQIKLANQNERLSYRYDKQIDMIIVTIHDGVSNKVIRQIPSKEFVDMKLALQRHIGNVIQKTV